MSRKRVFIAFLLIAFVLLATSSVVFKFVEVDHVIEYVIYGLLAFDVLALAVLRFRKAVFRRKREYWAESRKEVHALSKLVSVVFQILLFAFLIYLIAREFYPLSFINMTYFLIAVVVFGFLNVVLPCEEVEKRPCYWVVGFVSLFGAVYIGIKVKQLGWLAYVIGITTGLLIALLSTMVYEEELEP